MKNSISCPFPFIAGSFLAGINRAKTLRPVAVVAALAFFLPPMARAQVNIYVDSTQNWIGYMNVYALPSNGGGYQFGSAWATSDLTAFFSGEALTLIPNTNVWETTNTYWVQSDGVTPNEIMDASMYVQNDSLAGTNVIFSGDCETNTLASSYTCTAFIKDFSPSYSLVNSATVPLTPGPFSINLTTQPGDNIQYGFETIGPDANPATVASLGEVVINAPKVTNVIVSPITFTDGYMSWTANPNDAPGYGGNNPGGQVWGVAALPAVLSSTLLTLSPNTNTYAPGNDYWVNADGSGANIMDASFYAEVDGGLYANTSLTFTFVVLSNTLVSPYTADGWIKDFGPGYAFNGEYQVNLTPGTNTVTYPLTGNNPGEIVQYGFEVIGPDANPATVASLGQVVIAVPSTTNLAVLPVNPVALVGGSQAFTVTATGAGLNYQWQQNGVDLTNGGTVSGATSSSLTLNNLQPGAEGTYTVVASNSTSTNNASTYLTVLNPAHLTVDPNAPWIGFENWFYDNAGTEGAFLGQSVEPPSHLPASFSGAVLTLLPNTSDYNTNNPEFVNPDGSPAAIIEADFYVQDDALAGQTLTFVGYCPSNTLDTNYSSTVFIEDFVPTYASFMAANAMLVTGQPFSITLATTAGDHIEYGFKTVGPVANPATVAALGQAQASINPPPVTASVAGGVVSLSFPTESGLAYTVQYKSNLTDSTWQTLSTVNGTAATVTVTDTTGSTHRFYRLSIR
jgi:hypothetical protein